MGIGARLQSHKAKLKKETSNYTFRCLQNPGRPNGHRSITSQLNVIKKCGQKVSKEGGVVDEKWTDIVKNPYKKK